LGRVFSRFCDADLGDTRCGLDIDVDAFRAAGAVAEALSGAAFRAAGFADYADGWFARGRLVWDEGGQSEIATHRRGDGDAIFELIDAPAFALTAGASFIVYAGCDKRFETCRAKFANSANFRGFPHMPGNDALQSGPAQGQRLDGSSRFR